MVLERELIVEKVTAFWVRSALLAGRKRTAESKSLLCAACGLSKHYGCARRLSTSPIATCMKGFDGEFIKSNADA
jgi:hypothetical protein